METPNNHTRSSSANDATTTTTTTAITPITTTTTTTTAPTTPTAHRRIPFVHRLSSFRRNHHGKNTSSNMQPLTSSVSDTTAATAPGPAASGATTPTKTKEDFLSSDLILKVAVIRGKSLTREDEVKIPKKAAKKLVALCYP